MHLHLTESRGENLLYVIWANGEQEKARAMSQLKRQLNQQLFRLGSGGQYI